MNKKHDSLSLFTEVLIEFINVNEVVEYNRHGTEKIRSGFELKPLHVVLMDGDIRLSKLRNRLNYSS